MKILIIVLIVLLILVSAALVYALRYIWKIFKSIMDAFG